MSCDCNATFGELRLNSEGEITYNPRVSDVDYIDLDILNCSGNECSITCEPFDPEGIDYFEFVGKLKVTDRNGEPAWLELVEIDLSLSRQLENGEWKDIPIGTFSQPLATSTPIPNSCEETE